MIDLTELTPIADFRRLPSVCITRQVQKMGGIADDLST